MVKKANDDVVEVQAETLPVLEAETVHVETVAPVDYQYTAPVPTEEAQLVFNAKEAKEWLAWSYKRLASSFMSVRFEPEGIADEHVSFCLRLAVSAVLPQGFMFVPSAFEGHEQLSGLVPAAPVPGYSVYFRP